MIGLIILLAICIMVIYSLAIHVACLSQIVLDIENQRNSAVAKLGQITSKRYYFDDENSIQEWN